MDPEEKKPAEIRSGDIFGGLLVGIYFGLIAVLCLDGGKTMAAYEDGYDDGFKLSYKDTRKQLAGR